METTITINANSLKYDTYHCITFSQAKNPLLTDEDEQIAFEIIDVRILYVVNSIKLTILLHFNSLK